MTVTTKGSVKLRAVPTQNNTERPIVWKFKNVNSDQIRREYNLIREKSTNSANQASVRAAHSDFAEHYPQLFTVATSPDICDRKAHILFDMIERAQKNSQDDMDKEAAIFGQQAWDEHADPNRKVKD